MDATIIYFSISPHPPTNLFLASSLAIGYLSFRALMKDTEDGLRYLVHFLHGIASARDSSAASLHAGRQLYNIHPAMEGRSCSTSVRCNGGGSQGWELPPLWAVLTTVTTGLSILSPYFPQYTELPAKIMLFSNDTWWCSSQELLKALCALCSSVWWNNNNNPAWEGSLTC